MGRLKGKGNGSTRGVLPSGCSREMTSGGWRSSARSSGDPHPGVRARLRAVGHRLARVRRRRRVAYLVCMGLSASCQCDSNDIGVHNTCPFVVSVSEAGRAFESVLNVASGAHVLFGTTTDSFGSQTFVIDNPNDRRLTVTYTVPREELAPALLPNGKKYADYEFVLPPACEVLAIR